MTDRSSTLRLFSLLRALEAHVGHSSESEVLSEPFASARAEAMRHRISVILSSTRDRDARSLGSRLPSGMGAKRELLRRVLTMRPAQSSPGISFSTPESLSDSEVESALETMLQAGLLPKEPEKK